MMRLLYVSIFHVILTFLHYLHMIIVFFNNMIIICLESNTTHEKQVVIMTIMCVYYIIIKGLQYDNPTNQETYVYKIFLVILYLLFIFTVSNT